MLLDVAYLPQIGINANLAMHDCGPACLAMLINHVKGTRLTVDDVCDLIGISGTGAGAGIWQLQGVAKTYDVRMLRLSGLQPVEIEETIGQSSQPGIALIRYQYLPNKYDHIYRGGHYVVIVGATGTHVVIHDPYWPDERGANQYVPFAAFQQAWTADGKDFRVSGQALVVIE